MTALEEAELAGIDLSLIEVSLIEVSLDYSYDQRALQHQAALDNLYLETELGPIDLLGSVKGVGDFERVRAVSIEIGLF